MINKYAQFHFLRKTRKFRIPNNIQQVTVQKTARVITENDIVKLLLHLQIKKKKTFQTLIKKYSDF